MYVCTYVLMYLPLHPSIHLFDFIEFSCSERRRLRVICNQEDRKRHEWGYVG